MDTGRRGIRHIGREAHALLLSSQEHQLSQPLILISLYLKFFLWQLFFFLYFFPSFLYFPTISPYTDVKENKTFLTYKEIQMGSGAKPYMRKGFLIYEEMRKFFPIYED
jgi:hypothetical protein